MKTQVELYEVEDVRQETIEQCEEAQKLIAELGLDGQKSEATTAAVARFPFRLMTDEELFVYGQLCPSHQSLKTFADSPIPLEVLKTAAYAKNLQDSRIAYMEVWSASSVRVKDPVLVARDQQYSSKNYILARWGEELLPLEVLIPQAIKVWYTKRVDAINAGIATLQMELLKPCPQSVPSGRSEPYISL